MGKVGIPPDDKGGAFDVVDQKWLTALAGGQNWRYVTVPAHVGGGQLLATRLNPGFQLYQISPVLNANDSVALPGAKAPFFFIITNAGTNNATIYTLPGTTDTINSHAGTAGMTITPNSSFICVCTQDGAWSIPSGSGGAPSSLVVNSTAITAGSANQLLYDNGGTLEEASVGAGLSLVGSVLSALAATLTNNSTTIAGGGANQLLYDNGGTLEEATVSGTLTFAGGVLSSLSKLINNSTLITGGAANKLLYDNGGTLEEAAVGPGLTFTGGILSTTASGLGLVNNSTSISGGAANQILYDNGGTLKEATVGTGLTFTGGVLASTSSSGLINNSTLISGGAANQLLYDNGGTLKEATVSTGLSFSGGVLTATSSSGLVNNSTTITGGAANQLLYDNGGTLEEAIIGTGITFGAGILSSQGTATVGSIAALRNYGQGFIQNGDQVYVEGYGSTNDGGQGLFYWSSTSTASDDGGTAIDPTWNTMPAPGPNLIQNPNFASGSANWTTTAGSPTFTGNQCSNNGNGFAQIRQSLTGLTPNSTYIISMTYTMAASPAGGFIGIGPPPNPVADQFTTEASPTVWSFTFGQGASTTNTFQVGFGNSLITFTNVVFQLAAGGRFLRVIDQPNVCEPEWWGASGGGAVDDFAALNSAFNFAESVPNQLNMGCRGIVKMGAGRRYLCNTGLSFNPALMGIEGNNSFIDFSNISSAPSAGGCLAVIGNTESGFLLPYGGNLTVIQNLGIYSSASYPYHAGVIGVYVGGADTVQGLTLSHVNVRGFETGIYFSSNTYQITLHRCYVLNTVTCFAQLNNPGNSGEMNVIDSCSFFNSVCGIDFQNSNGQLSIINTSIDYNSIMARTQSGPLFFTRCHFETSDSPGGGGLLPGSSTPTSGTYFDCNGSYLASMAFDACEFLETGSSGTAGVLFYSKVGSGGIRVRNPLWAGGGWASSIPMTLVPTVGGMQPTLSSSDITFSNSNNTLTAGSGSDQGITNLNLTSFVGKWVFTVTLNNTVTLTGNPQLCVGIATPTTGGLNNGIQGAYATTANFGGGLPPAGDVWLVSNGHIGSPLAVAGPVTSGTVWWFAYDSVGGHFWFSPDAGVHWNGSLVSSPDAGTGGFLIGNIGGGPVIQFANAADQMTVNFAPSTAGIPNITTFNPAVNTFTLSGGGPVDVSRSLVQFNPTTWPMPVMMDIANGLPADPTFENSTVSTGFLDPWLLYADTAPITSAYAGTNISISVSTAKPFTGLNSLAAVKAGAAATAAAFAFYKPCQLNEMHTWAIEYAASANSLGTFRLSVFYADVLYYNSSGLPVFGNVTESYHATLTPTTAYQSSISSQSARPQAPSFATHALFVFDMLSMGAGTLYIDNVQFYRL